MTRPHCASPAGNQFHSVQFQIHYISAGNHNNILSKNAFLRGGTHAARLQKHVFQSKQYGKKIHQGLNLPRLSGHHMYDRIRDHSDGDTFGDTIG